MNIGAKRVISDASEMVDIIEANTQTGDNVLIMSPSVAESVAAKIEDKVFRLL